MHGLEADTCMSAPSHSGTRTKRTSTRAISVCASAVTASPPIHFEGRVATYSLVPPAILFATRSDLDVSES